MKKIEQLLCTRRAALLGMAGAIAEIAACGGGGTDVAGLSSGGTGSFTSGTISGFGSIIVNGIRYNNDTASVLSNDDSVSSGQSLQLGMVVNIEGSAVTPAATATGLPTATAYRITYGSEWVGPISQKIIPSATSGETAFEILGHKVDVLSTTIFDGTAKNYAELNNGQYAEIYGYVDPANGRIQASRIEVSSSQPATYKLTGALTQINAASKTAYLGTTAINWTNAAVLPTGVFNGDFVRVVLNSSASGDVWTASSIKPLNSPLTRLSTDHDYEAEIHGSITAYQSNASFVVNGIPVNASGAQISEALGVGSLVEIEGSIRSGQLVATKVAVKTASQVEAQEFEFYGLVSSVTAQTFVVRGETFYYGVNTQNINLLSQNPLPYVKVKALRANGRWQAIELEIED